MLQALKPNNTPWYMLGALIVACAVAWPYVKPIVFPQPSGQGGVVIDTLVVKDTLVIRDTIFSEPKAPEPTPADNFRAALRKQLNTLKQPLYSSYTVLTNDNYDKVDAIYTDCFNKSMAAANALSQEWSKKYPSYSNDFEAIVSKELSAAYNKYLRDVVAKDSR
jgi:hypothetical protein